ncbi:MAG: 30S ribosomal protein S15 [Nitrososphaerales archaeon]
MARIHAHRKGKSHSTRPVKSANASWVTMGKDEITSLVVNMAKDGLGPSEIGIRLRDEYGIPLAKDVLGKPINKILQENNVSPEMPEDLDLLVRKALGLQKHLRTHPADRNNIRSLELLEAKVHRLSKYYKRQGKLPQNWKYSTVVAKLE